MHKNDCQVSNNCDDIVILITILRKIVILSNPVPTYDEVGKVNEDPLLNGSRITAGVICE